jgi:tetratricopeptide (TPR) repeat protein
MVALFQGRYDAAETRYQQALSIRQRLADVPGEADLMDQMGLLETLRGKPGPALAQFRRAEEIRQS